MWKHSQRTFLTVTLNNTQYFMTSVNFLVIIAHWLLIVNREKPTRSKWRQVTEAHIFKCQRLLPSYFPKAKNLYHFHNVCGLKLSLFQCEIVDYFDLHYFIKSNCLWYSRLQNFTQEYLTIHSLMFLNISIPTGLW